MKKHHHELRCSEKEPTRSSDSQSATSNAQPLSGDPPGVGGKEGKPGNDHDNFPGPPFTFVHHLIASYDRRWDGILERWGVKAAPALYLKTWQEPRTSRRRLTYLSTAVVVSSLLFIMWHFYLLALGLFAKDATPLVIKEGVGRLPALGWNSWNAFHCDITESQFLDAAQKLVDLGLKDAGYEYVNIDDCWQVKDHRDSKTQRLLPDLKKFPDGINGTADKIHKLGLKIGIYSSAGSLTCAGYQASIGHESIDAKTWADWGIDYLKYDNCNIPSNWTDPCRFCVPDDRSYDHPMDLVNGSCTKNVQGLCPSNTDWSKSHTAERFRIMRDALLAQDRPILYSLCEWGEAGVQQWGNATGSSWRMSGDIDPSWSRVVDILNQNSFNLNNVDFWGHSDPDMLEVGNGLTVQESRTHFATWAAMKSPLLIGTDLTKISPDQLSILQNKYLLAFNQDPVIGKPAQPYKWGTNPDWTFNSTFPAEFWSGASSKGTLVLLFNPYSATRTKSAVWKEIPELKNGGGYQVTDVWTGKDLGCIKDKLDVQVQGHDTAAFLVTKGCYADPTLRLKRHPLQSLMNRLAGDW